MYYTMHHWVAKPGHEDGLIAGLRRLEGVIQPYVTASYIGRDLARPGSIVAFVSWANRATYEAFSTHPDARRIVREAISPHLDADAGGAITHMEPLPWR